ncbi:C-terminal processing peptidase-3. Serine peptidase. MEROPS family S41A [Geosporobacter subterraneus DSM 17957]|uniref:C-terminal processing peptidase-3. Serine peptidase. MEROPS family S41A n=2 Tax=Geosporobacter TaxID=390805 RepID=A0A1M6P8Q4_9FIRM|nr:C-terminal processing peptidase-3. Serine peptidase. MEROPS family S41A [Geosporobacter subterraneus DSM 17957]
MNIGVKLNMISKKNAVIGAIILVIITSMMTFTVTNIVTLTVGNKVVIPKSDFEYYKDIQRTYSKVLALKDFIEKNYYKPVDTEKMEDGIIRGLFASLEDPYSVYMNNKEFDDFMVHTKGTYGGIGVIMTPGEDGFVTVVSPIEDTPGERAGLISGDKIIKVDGKDVTAEKLDEAVAMIKGDPGTKVELTVVRTGREDSFTVKITREEIRLKTVKSRILENNIGYIRITMFDEQTADDFKTQLNQLKKKNITGLVIDLRNNPGGLLSECVKIADELLGKQVIVYTEDRAGNREYERSNGKKVEFPYVLLVNKGSASASEILAGAVKDTESGTLIGTTTFGKGLVQRVKPLEDGTGFKLTTSQYFTPNGVNIHGKGIEPNIVVEMPEELIERGNITDAEDLQLQKGLEVLKKKIGS